jgi:hypothetical protein
LRGQRRRDRADHADHGDDPHQAPQPNANSPAR